MELIINCLLNMSESLHHKINKPAADEVIEAANACLDIIHQENVSPVNKIHQLRAYCRTVSYTDQPAAYAIIRTVMARISALIEEIERNTKPPVIGRIHPRRRFYS